MQAQTAFQAAFAKAGFQVDSGRLRAAAYSALRRADVSPMRALAQFQQVVETDRELMRAIVFEYLQDCAADMRGEGLVGGGLSRFETQKRIACADQSVEVEKGHRNLAEKASDGVPSSTSPKSRSDGHGNRAEEAKIKLLSLRDPLCDGGDHRINDTQSATVIPVAKPNPPRGLSAIASIQAVVARSIFDTFTVRDGTPIGDLAWNELRNLARTNEREARVLRYVEGYASNVRPGALVRETIREEVLVAAIKHAEEAENVDA